MSSANRSRTQVSSDEAFDGIIAVGLMFLLPTEVQREVFRKVSLALNPGGGFLFTCPAQTCAWTDVLTGRQSRSLRVEEYQAVLSAVGLTLAAEYVDQGDNHYCAAGRP